MLNKDWLIEGHIDLEYKQYVLLAYLKNVDQNFKNKRLYPIFSELLFHYKNLLQVKENKELLKEQFPKKLSKADFESLRLIYERMVEDGDVMREIEEIILFALPHFEAQLDHGKELFDDVEQHISISPVGITPLNGDEGYFFLQEAFSKETSVFEFRASVLTDDSGKYRLLHTDFLESVRKGIGTTYENLKVALVKKYNKYANPATYLVEANNPYPREETLLPVVKRKLIRLVTAA